MHLFPDVQHNLETNLLIKDVLELLSIIFWGIFTKCCVTVFLHVQQFIYVAV